VKLSEAFELYRRDVIVFQNQSAKTEQGLIYSLHSFTRVFGDVDVKYLTFEDVRKWKVIVSKTCSPNTVREYILKLRVVLRHLQKLDIESLDPELVPVPKRNNLLPKAASRDDVIKMLRACASNRNCHNRIRNKLIISLLYNSGIRVAELCSLNRDSIVDKHFTIVGKGSKPRLCFIDDNTDRRLKEYLAIRKDTNPALFVTFINNKRMNPGDVQECFRHIGARAGVENAHPHFLRHGYATALMPNGIHIINFTKFIIMTIMKCEFREL